MRPDDDDDGESVWERRRAPAALIDVECMAAQLGVRRDFSLRWGGGVWLVRVAAQKVLLSNRTYVQYQDLRGYAHALRTDVATGVGG